MVNAKGSILILCVDRDGDLSSKTGIRTPILGREANLNAAIALALKDPEEADANAMFEAIRTFDRLKEEGEPLERLQIATISGFELGGVSADRKLVKELSQVLNEFQADEVILVTDGFADEDVIPLIKSRTPITSIRRVVVRHSKSIEEAAAVLTRYLKAVIDNPRYSKIVLGLPGLLLISIALLTAFNLLQYGWIVLTLVVGSYLFIKGFRIDDVVQRLYVWAREYSPPSPPALVANFGTAIGLLLIVMSCYQGVSYAIAQLQEGAYALAPEVLSKLIGWFIEGSILLMAIGICIILAGRAVGWYFERDPRLLRAAILIVAIGWLSQVLREASKTLLDPLRPISIELILFALAGIVLIVVAISIVTAVQRANVDFFKGKEC